LVDNYVISCYDDPARGDRNTAALSFKMAVAQRGYETTKKMKK